MKCEKATAEITKYTPLSGGGHKSTYRLPPELENKKSLLSIVCNDNKCFLYSITAHFHPAPDHPERVKSYAPFIHEFDMGKAEFPIKLSAIKKVKLNKRIVDNIIHPYF